MKLESFHTPEDKVRYKLVRTDNYTDVPGKIVSADPDTGECMMEIAGETRNLSFGPGGFKIVSAKRGAG